MEWIVLLLLHLLFLLFVRHDCAETWCPQLSSDVELAAALQKCYLLRGGVARSVCTTSVTIDKNR